MKKKAIVIGGGFAGMANACCLANAGFEVTLVEKNPAVGGRARALEQDGFRFDMGPTWYWMPEVFEQFFQQFGKSVSDYYHIDRLDPGYRIVFGKTDHVDIPANREALYALFEKIEEGSSSKLQSYLRSAEIKYTVGMGEFVYKPGLSIAEFFQLKLLKAAGNLDLLKNIRKYINANFKSKKLRQILEFPVLFLGARPQDTPALYSLMNYADLVLGTWYPKGGMISVVKAFEQLCQELGVTIKKNTEVQEFKIDNSKITGVVCEGAILEADIVVASADYHHTEQLLNEKYRTYSASYWNSRKMAPAAVLFYLGLNKKIKGLQHHTLFFDTHFDEHSNEIYLNQRWPNDPLFYLSCPSKTDISCAPAGGENLTILVPLAVGLTDNDQARETVFEKVIHRLETITNQDIRKHIVYKKSYAHKDFIADYNAYKGNAYGLANTLKQTAILRPRIKSKKVKNLYFAGQLTVPGPGVPPAIISGQIVAQQVQKDLM